ncbi:MAG TPA: BlaI/MecI/CopY family transcriptional regulator [Streptosporangiaceae bacterium]|jgi:predicted transcriptional regulator
MGDDGLAPEVYADADTGPGASRRPHGALEAAVLDVLRVAAVPLSPGQVRERLAEDLSYSTVVTIVSRLHAKGLLERERAGRAFVYRPVDDASRAASRMSQALQAGSDHGAVLSRFVSGLSGRDAVLLRSLLGEAGGELPGQTGG